MAKNNNSTSGAVQLSNQALLGDQINDLSDQKSSAIGKAVMLIVLAAACMLSGGAAKLGLLGNTAATMGVMGLSTATLFLCLSPVIAAFGIIGFRHAGQLTNEIAAKQRQRDSSKETRGSGRISIEQGSPAMSTAAGPAKAAQPSSTVSAPPMPANSNAPKTPPKTRPERS